MSERVGSYAYGMDGDDQIRGLAETVAEDYAQTAEVKWHSRSRKSLSPRADVGDITYAEYLNAYCPRA